MAGPISGSPLQTQEKSRAILIGKKDRAQRGEAAGVGAQDLNAECDAISVCPEVGTRSLLWKPFP